MTPESKINIARIGAYALMYFILGDLYVSYLTHDVNDMSTMFDLNVFDPKPETYNTYALIAAAAATSGLVWYIKRQRAKL